MNVRSLAKPALSFALAACLAGCGSLDGILPNHTQPGPSINAGASSHEGPVSDAEKIKVAPLASTDLECPTIEIAEGGSTVRVGGPENQAVRYQLDIGDVSRNCEPRGSQFALNIGVAILALVGPAGSPGTFSSDLKVQVVSTADKKPVYQKVYKVAVNTNGGMRGTYDLVMDPILLPLERTNLDDLFEVTIGFGNSVSTKPTVRKTPKPRKTVAN